MNKNTASIEQLYAYAYQPRIPFTANNGWKIYDPIKEYQRMGVDNGSTMWRFTTINQDYKVSVKKIICFFFQDINNFFFYVSIHQLIHVQW
jgi:hypothetical protein